LKRPADYAPRRHQPSMPIVVPSRDALPHGLADAVARFGRIWSHPALGETVSVRFSARLSKTWARTNLGTRTVTLTVSLKDDPARLEEVLCHELAHIVAHDAIGRRQGPHGPTWHALVRAAGHEPVLRLLDGGKGAPRRGRSALRFLHRCQVCDFSRVAQRRMRAWRCADCVAAGLDGDLVVVTQRVAG
jgi:predicted SprT family Zn-dependent metalloprotease